MREQPNPQKLIDDATQLMQAARKGNLQDITAIRDRHTDRDFIRLIAKQDLSGYTALIEASENGHKDVVQLLLQTLQDADTDISATINHANKSGRTALIHASHNGHTEIVQHLLQALQVANADVVPAAINHANNDSYTALIWASNNGHIEIVKLLVQALRDAGADIQAAVNHQSVDSYTALIGASVNGHTDIIRLLLRALRDAGAGMSAALNHQDSNGMKVLTRASGMGNIDVVQLLLQTLRDAGEDMQAALNHQDADGWTGLIAASYDGYTDIVRLLLQALHDAGADIQEELNHQDNQGNTALMWASENNHTETVKLLLANGAHLRIIDAQTVASLIANNNLAIPEDKLHAIMQRGDITWAEKDYAHFSQKRAEDKKTLDQLTSWAIILGYEAFVEKVLPLLLDTLNLETHTEYLRLALQAQKFAIAERLLMTLNGNDEYGQDNKQTVCNYLLHLMEIERGPLPAIEFLQRHGALYKQYTQAHCEESDSSLLVKHTLFQEQKTLDELRLEAHTEYLRLALHEEKFVVAERLLEAINSKDEYGQDNKQTVCNYLLHLMEIERGPLPAIEFLQRHGAIYKQYTQAHCEESDSSLLEKHTLFQEQIMEENHSRCFIEFNQTHSIGTICKQYSVDLRQSLAQKNQTLVHLACARNDPAMLKRVTKSTQP